MALAAALLVWMGATSSAQHLAVRDPVTGLAARGLDPVAYFVDGEPRAGKPELEAVWSGAVWRFVNEGNRAAFEEAPEIYAPRYGGHCAVAVARGFLAEGDARLWALHEERLYFFHSPANRRAFIMDAAGFIASADARWPIRGRPSSAD